MPSSLRARLLATTCAVLAAGIPLATTAATNIGVTSAVVPAARGTPTEGTTRVLQVGLDMQANERVQTDADGKAHLLFLDGSALSIGPNSEVVLDEFVYDPVSKTGKIALSATRGVFRLVGGQISKTTPVTLTTPTATIGVRGGIAAINADGNGVSAAFIYGVDMFVQAQERVERAERPGSLIQVPPGGAPLPPIPLTTELANAQNAAFEGGGDQDSAGGPAVSDEDVAGTQISDLNSGSAALDVAPAAGGAGAPPSPTAPLGNELAQASQLGQPPAQLPQDQGGLLPPSPTDPAPPGSSTTFTVQGAYSGRLKRVDIETLQTQDAAPGQNLGFAGTFAPNAFTGQAQNGAPFVVTPQVQEDVELDLFGGLADPQPFGSGSLQALFIPIFGDPDFLLVQLFDSAGVEGGDFSFYFGFAGVPTPTASIPTSGFDSYLLFDFFNESAGLFAPPGVATVEANLPPQAYVAWNNSAPGASRAFLIPSLTISGEGLSQVSTTSAVVGHLLNDGSGRPFLQAWARGFGASSSSPAASFFAGGVSTSDGGEGSDFFGSTGPNYFALEGAAVDSADTVVSQGIGVVGASQPAFFPNIYGSSVPFAPQTRTTRTLNGFATGVIANFNSAGTFTGLGDFLNFLHSDVVIATNAETNRVDVAFDLTTNSESSLDFRLGGVSDDGSSAFIDDHLFAAIDRPTSATLVSGFGLASERSILLTAEAMNLVDALPPGVTLCTCEHTTWGFLSARLQTPTGSRLEVLNAPFAAGEIAVASQYNVTQSALYSGHVFGNVTRGVGVNERTYTAFGNISLSADFTPGMVNITNVQVTNFDGGSLSGSGSGPVAAPGNPGYTFFLSGDIPGAGTVFAGGRGSFVGPGAPPAATVGVINGTPEGGGYSMNVGYVAQR